MTIRFVLERMKGGFAIEQKNILGFEHEDIIYIVIPITFFNKIDIFLLCSFIGTPIFLFITSAIFLLELKLFSNSSNVDSCAVCIFLE